MKSYGLVLFCVGKAGLFEKNNFQITGRVVINIIPSAIHSICLARLNPNLSLTQVSRKYPPSIIEVTHVRLPKILYKIKVGLSIRTTPATIGANVRMMGKNLARNMVPFPFLS